MLPFAAAAFWFSLTHRRCPSLSIYLGLSELSLRGGLPCEPLSVGTVCRVLLPALLLAACITVLSGWK